MDVQRYAHTWAVDPPLPADNGKWVLYADHARIVAEKEQIAKDVIDAIRAQHDAEMSRQKADYEFLLAEADKAHAAALAEAYTLMGAAVENVIEAEQPRTITADCLHLAEMYVGQSGRDNEYGRRSSVIECLACGALRLDDETVPNGVHHWYAADEVAATDGEATP